LNGSLVVRGVKGEEGGYQCTATLPGVGTIISRVARVTVLGQLVFNLES